MSFAVADTLSTNVYGATNSDVANQLIDIGGGGGCGWMGPDGVAFNPFNTDGGGFVLQLAYLP